MKRQTVVPTLSKGDETTAPSVYSKILQSKGTRTITRGAGSFVGLPKMSFVEQTAAHTTRMLNEYASSEVRHPLRRGSPARNSS